MKKKSKGTKKNMRKKNRKKVKEKKEWEMEEYSHSGWIKIEKNENFF